MIVFAGDLHGSPESLHLIAESLGLSDSELNWKARDTVFVLTGDACDRGRNSASIYRLVMKWQQEAGSYGSEVVFLKGNHEIMNIDGDLYYNTPEETASYGNGFSDGIVEKRKAFAAGGWVYDWLSEQPFIVKRGPFIAAHADFPSEYRYFSVEQINDLSCMYYRQLLKGPAPVDPLLWSREARSPRHGYEAALKDFLALNGAKCWVCGHTPSMTGRMRSLFGSSYICVDTAMTLGIGRTSALVFNNYVLQARYFDGKGGVLTEDLSF